ncbi:asparagine synthase-related protein [Allocoleopsis sp.]|uniref:asparagine synthase-related protein n=1 Tax=Allocoleopsis sp. TaxID=3088169 RepID=UPI002FD2D5A3
MANFILIVDPDPERRSHYIKTIKPHLPLVEGLSTNSCCSGDFDAIWAASPHAPISYLTDEGGAAIVLGEAMKRDSSERINACSLRNLWKSSPNRTLLPFDGFHALAVYHPHLGLTVTADLLGLFPIYYYTRGDVLLVGSSPELFRYHPLFKQVFNPAGLVGILLTNALFDGQTLWQDVRRLGVGYLLSWQPGTEPKEIRQYQITDIDGGSEYAAVPFDEQIDILDGVIDQTLSRHAPPDQRYCLFLSGGLDSRMLGGFLQRRGVDTVALSVGRRTDLEMECAIPVARTLRFEHHTTTIPFERYPLYADLVVNWEHLANGCNTIMGLGWGINSYLGNLAPRVITGFLLDHIISVKSFYYLSTKKLCFEDFFPQRINHCGCAPQLLEKLLKKEVFGDLVRERCDRIRTVYESYSDVEFKRSWWFELYHRKRCLLGSVGGWQLCFGAWPILPCLDWEMLKTAATLPLEALQQRCAQYELVRTRFPQLATLPLDRNAFNTEPFQLTGRGQRYIHRLYQMQAKWRQFQQQKLGYERRHYYRTLDLNNPGWRSVRQQAEPYREQVRHLFHEEVLNELLPPPDEPVQFAIDPITESSKLKVLLGFLLWSRNYL